MVPQFNNQTATYRPAMVNALHPIEPPRRPTQRNSTHIPDALNVKNDPISKQIERALTHPKEYKLNIITNQLKYHHEFESPKHRGLGEIEIFISGLKEQSHERITIALDSLGGACRDTFASIFGLYILNNGTSDMRKNFKISVDTILDACGKQRSNGSFLPEQRAEVIKHIKTLSQTTIQFSMPATKMVKKGRQWVEENTEVKVEGPILLYGGTIGEYSKITGKEYWEFHDISFGPWADFIGGKVQTKLLPQQVLAYSPQNEPFHKKLGYYIHELFRNNAYRTKGVMPYGITMGALFEGAFINPPRERGKFKDDIDRALKHLKQDGVIGDYWYMAEKNHPDDVEKVEKRIGRWFDAYLDLFINFSPPETTISHYRNIAKKEKDEN